MSYYKCNQCEEPVEVRDVYRYGAPAGARYDFTDDDFGDLECCQCGSTNVDYKAGEPEDDDNDY